MEYLEVTQWRNALIFKNEPLNLWELYYELSVVGPSGNCGIQPLLISHYPYHIPIRTITFILSPPSSSGGSHQQEELLKSIAMGLNFPEARQQGLLSAIGIKVSFWLELVFESKPQF